MGQRFHALSIDDLAALAGGGDAEPAVVATLRTGQLTKHKLLLHGVVRLGGRAMPDAAPALQECHELLAKMETEDPDQVALVVGNPHVGAWAARCLRQLSSGGSSARSDASHLAAVTAAAAIRVGYPCTLALRPVDGTIMLPTLGRARVQGGDQASLTVTGPMQAAISVGHQKVSISGSPEQDGPDWLGLRWLTFGDRRIPLDDLDPYRNYGRCPLTGRLTPSEADHWRRALDDAWQLLSTHYPGYAATLREGITSLVPIMLRADDKNISATSGDAFAAVAASTPADGVALALALIHEFQHAKLCAVIDLEPLFRRHSEQLFYAAWRPDPRPAGALYHGVFAHMGVTDFWRIRRGLATGSDRIVAEVEFTRWLGQTLDAATRLDGHSELTDAGQGLISQIVARLEGWLDEPVPAQARELAEMTAADHMSCWRLRNMSPDEHAVTELAHSYLSGGTARNAVPTEIKPPDDDEPVRNARADLLYQKLCDPGRFAGDAADSRDDPEISCVQGDYVRAAQGYLAQIRIDPASRHAWSGLALVSEPGSSLRRIPEVIYAVYHELKQKSVSPIDVFTLAEWLSLPAQIDDVPGVSGVVNH